MDGSVTEVKSIWMDKWGAVFATGDNRFNGIYSSPVLCA